MSLKRVSILIGAFLCVALASSAQAQIPRKWSLTGGGAQFHIGDGLQLPIQTPAALQGVTGTIFPPLLVPVAGTPLVAGTTDKPLKMGGGRQGYQRDLTVQAGALKRVASQTTVGLKFSNPVVFAVGTNFNYTWPHQMAMFREGNTGPPTVTGFGGSVTYSNTLGARFGGAGFVRLSAGPPSGLIAPSATVYIKINTVTPPCKHPLFTSPPPGTNAACVNGILGVASPVAPASKTPNLFGAGGIAASTRMTPGVVLAPNVAAVEMGTAPLGTILNAALVASAALPTNMATSAAAPWTTGKVIITNGAAGGAAETFTNTGKDSRNASGVGTIQFVSGAVSLRPASGPNANRGWLQLVLSNPAPGTVLPSLSPMGLGAVATLILLAGGYALRRRIFA